MMWGIIMNEDTSEHLFFLGILSLLVMLLLLSIIAVEKYEADKLDSSSNNNSNSSLFLEEYDLSKHAVVTGYPEKESKVMILECINSTLRINNNSIYCENILE